MIYVYIYTYVYIYIAGLCWEKRLQLIPMFILCISLEGFSTNGDCGVVTNHVGLAADDVVAPWLPIYPAGVRILQVDPERSSFKQGSANVRHFPWRYSLEMVSEAFSWAEQEWGHSSCQPLFFFQFDMLGSQTYVHWRNLRISRVPNLELHL